MSAHRESPDFRDRQIPDTSGPNAEPVPSDAEPNAGCPDQRTASEARRWAVVDAEMERAPHLNVGRDERGLPVMPKPGGDWTHIGAASDHPWFLAGVVAELADIGSPGQAIDQGETNFALGFVSEMKPNDPAELLLLTQMAAIHRQTMLMARRLTQSQTVPQQDAAERALNKLARTFAVQMETLKRYRSKGQQVVRVERVMVGEGGQAIVGNVAHGGGDDDKS